MAWLAERPGNQRVPERTAKELSRLSSLEAAHSFVRSAGVDVLEGAGRESYNSYSVSANPAENLPSCDPTTRVYYAPQIVLPKVECDIVPFGTSVVNCLVPQADPVTAHKILVEYEYLVNNYSARMGALPFACITGHKSHDPEHDLDHRGFRFFFSPDPDTLYDRIYAALRSRESMSTAANREEKLRALEVYEQLRYCMKGKEKIGHTLLGDIKLHISHTVLVDLRD